MEACYKVQADIFDIRRDCPSSDDVFFIDTNVWYWQFYSRASLHRASYQVREYPRFIKKIIEQKCKILRCELTLSEISHLIEKSEFEIYCETHNLEESSGNKKAFRHNLQNERFAVISEVEDAWSQISSMSESLDMTIDEETTKEFLVKFRSHLVDGYDIFYLMRLLQEPNKPIILTDDGDFSTIPGIKIFTANRKVINFAEKCGKLKQR
jgi:hypothetical protein